MWSCQDERKANLFDLAFLELDVLADGGVVFLDRHLLRHGPSVLLLDVEKACIGRAVQPDLDGGWLGHGVFLVSPMRRAANLLSRPPKSRRVEAGASRHSLCRPA